MHKSIRALIPRTLLVAICTLILSSPAFGATIVILNNDAAGVGFNDPTPVAPVGNNIGTTLGQQRLNAFQFAANIWGSVLNSGPTITIRASWAALGCTATSATLGSAGAISIERDFLNAPFGNTWYSEALANSLANGDLDPANPQINARFNVNLGNTGCLDGTHFYLGLDNKHGSDVDLVAVLMHEFSHGLGFQTFTTTSTGVQFSDTQGPHPSIYDNFLHDDTTGKDWNLMTNAERAASAINNGNLVWTGPLVTANVHNVLGTPRLRVNSPGAIAGNYQVGTADFGPSLSPSGLTADVVQALDAGPSTTDGCSAISNAAAVAGKIALVDRGTCNFDIKTKNVQDAGAVGVIVANNVAGVIPMGGPDPIVSLITIPTVMISLADGTAVKGQLAVNATMLVDTSATQGADAQGHALMYTPTTFALGSSVSHWDTSEFPNQLMEPNISGDLTHSVAQPFDLTLLQLRDVGWSGNPIGDVPFYVRQHYLDFLNRQPDSSGLAFWSNDIFNCGIDQACIDVHHINVSAAFFISIEFQETGYLVERMYKAAYGDAVGHSTTGGAHTLPVPIVHFSEFLPDTQTIGQGVQVGIGNWQQQLDTNKQNFAAAFVQRSSFTSKYPTTLSPTNFVNQLFANAGVTPSAADRQTAISEFGVGTTTTVDVALRGRALRDVAENSTLNQQEFNRAFVLMQYFGYLRRDPNTGPDTDHAGYEFWLTKLNQFNGDYNAAEMVKAFIVSGEYRGRFGS